MDLPRGIKLNYVVDLIVPDVGLNDAPEVAKHRFSKRSPARSRCLSRCLSDDRGISFVQLGNYHIGDIESRIGSEVAITGRRRENQFSAAVVHCLRSRFAYL
jgi:hypothetical protein